MHKLSRHVLAGSAALALLLGAGCSEERKANEAPRAPTANSFEPAFTVGQQEVEDLKPVLATVRSKKVVEARVRTPGTVATLKVVEGDHVQPGQVLALVTDPKIALRIKASDAQIVALESRLANAKLDYERTAELTRRGVSAQARLDQAKTAFDVATNDLSAARSERAVIEKQVEEGQVLAPAPGRILRVPVTEGSVVMQGENIATIAANDYILRLEVPERHAQFMKKGDPLRVGSRGLEPDQGPSEGRIVHVYPEIQGGRVIADAEVPDLGTYFVGERTLAWISAGKRKTTMVPQDLVFKRYGLDYVRIATDSGKPVDVVVQLGQPARGDNVEVLAGVKPGDKIAKP